MYGYTTLDYINFNRLYRYMDRNNELGDNNRSKKNEESRIISTFFRSNSDDNRVIAYADSEALVDIYSSLCN